jgi:aspartyl/glutamyl-tRNA(Asn/Gln) amidotransferase B subunit
MSAVGWTHDGWEMVVGLEVHVELATATKLFSGSPNRFGDEPNTNIDPVTLGLPGALPVLNRYAVELAMRIGLALNCTVQPCTFARKNYFYPDMPTSYQISQYEDPLNVDGYLDLPDGSRVGIERAHLEQDAGKSTHVGGGEGRVHGADRSLIDLNRAGVPLVEIVSRPDICSPEQARTYVTELRAILLAIGASDAKMEEGSMRVDANVSVRRPGGDLGTRCEIKNVNSVRSVGRAIEYEARRQIVIIEGGEAVRQQTRHWTAERTHCATRKTPTIIATSSSPTWCRSPRPPSGSRMCGPDCRCCRRHVGVASRMRLASRPAARRSRSSSSAARTTTRSTSETPEVTSVGRSSISRKRSPKPVRALLLRPPTSPG